MPGREDDTQRTAAPSGSRWLSLGRWPVAAVLLAALVQTALPLRDLPIDDKFIVAVYARNLAEGHGWVYNLGEPVNASTSTLNPILGAFAGLFGASIPAALWWISLGAVALAIALLVTALSARGLWVAALLSTSPLIAATFGLESSLFVLGMVLVGQAADRGRWRWAFFWSGMICLVRGEGALIALLLIPLAWWKLRRLPWREGLWLLVPTLPWALYSWWQFGSPMPSTLEIKRLQGTSGLLLWAEGILTLLRRLLVEHALIQSVLMAGLGVAALIRIRRWPPSTLLFAAFGFGVGAAYIHWHIPATSYFWYAVPFVVCLLWLAAEGVEAILVWLGHRWGSAVALALLTLCLALRGDAEDWLIESYGGKSDEEVLYREAGEWIDRNVPRLDRVAVTEIGQNGWHMRRQLIDLAGLINPEIGRQIYGDQNVVGWLEDLEPEWILMRTVNDRVFLSQLLCHAGFRGAYTQRQEFRVDRSAQSFILFERTGSVAEAMALADQRRSERMAAATEEEHEALRQANETLDCSQWTQQGRVELGRWTEVQWEPGADGLDMRIWGGDGHVWMPWISVPADLVDTVHLRISMQRDTPLRGQVIQVYWRGCDAHGDRIVPDGMVEVPVRINTGEPQDVVIPVHSHPDWAAMSRLERLRIDPGYPGTRALIERIELRP